ncbi:hypothetical protein V2J09_005095 [Rumex salicifolius]
MATTTPPMEVIELILLRLPIKDILRSKCVAKSWNNRINNSHFANGRFNTSQMQHPDRNRDPYPNTLWLSISVKKIPSRSCKNASVGERSALEGSNGAHGLICASGQKFRFALLNPVTRSSRLLTQADLPPYTCTYRSLGFGYDKGTDDYKIIMVLVERPGSRQSRREIRVYSLKNNSWRVVSEEPNDEETSSHGAVANGKMHWLAIKTRRNGKCRILSIDFEQEQLWEVPMPNVPRRILYYQHEHGRSALLWFNTTDTMQERREIPGTEDFSEAIVLVGSFISVSQTK